MRRLINFLLFINAAANAQSPAKKCFAPGQGVDISKRIKGSTMVVNGAVTYVGQPDENGLFNATILVRKTWAKKNDNIKDNVVLRLGPFGTNKSCPQVKARMSYIFFIRNSGERKGKYRFYRIQLFPAYASEANLKAADQILGPKPTGPPSGIPMQMESKSIVHSIAGKAQLNKAGCMELHTPTHGSMDCLSNGRQCNFKCEEGYTMAGFHRKVCMGKKGGWKPSKPVLCHGEDSLEMGMIEMSKNLPQLKLASNNASIHNSYATAKPTARPQPVPLRPNIKLAPQETSDNGDSASKLMNVMKQLANGNNAFGLASSNEKIVTTEAPRDDFFLGLNPNRCDVNTGRFRQNNRWNKGFEGSVNVVSDQRITSEWILLMTFDTKIENIQLFGRRYVIRKVSADKQIYAVKAASYSPLFPQMPLEVVFSADFSGYGTPDAKVELYSNCQDGDKTALTSRPNGFLRPTPQPKAFVRRTKSYLQTTKPVLILPGVKNVYGTELTANFDIPQCSPWQPAGRLPGTGQVFPRWISSVFKSADRYDYNELLHKSLLFVEAQRSGVLIGESANNIPWRGDSGLKDGCLEEKDLIGGWYHGSDYVKHGLPTASAATVMLWGLVDYKDAYISTGEYDFAKSQMKWIIDYYMKAHTSKFELYVQVGEPQSDSMYWGRAEEMDMDRPAKKITTEFPGSDVAAETAAAFAAASIVFAKDDETYAAKCLQHARDLWEFALTYQGSYSDHIETGEKYKPETGYMDELIWGAIWIYKATNDYYYLEQAEILFEEANFYSPKVFSWDDKRAGILVMLSKITGREVYKSALNQFMNWLIESAYRTPKGLVWLDETSPNGFAANAALIALQAADVFQDYRTIFTNFAKQQVNYILGDTGRSFIVGYGRNPPQKAYHRGSSCQDVPSPCTWQDRQSTRGNPQVLFGAIVSGPDRLDRYEDSRTQRFNDVSLDATAGIMSAVAGLKKNTHSNKGFRVLGRWGG